MRYLDMANEILKLAGLHLKKIHIYYSNYIWNSTGISLTFGDLGMFLVKVFDNNCQTLHVRLIQTVPTIQNKTFIRERERRKKEIGIWTTLHFLLMITLDMITLFSNLTECGI